MASFKRPAMKPSGYRKRTFKKRRTNRLYKAYKRNYASEATPMMVSGKFYRSLPSNMPLCLQANGDCRYQIDTFSGSKAFECYYVFYNPLNNLDTINSGGPTGLRDLKCYPMIHLMSIYQEAKIRNVKYTLDISLDVKGTQITGVNEIIPPQRLDVAFGVVPLSYIRASNQTPHPITAAGDFYSGVDYYSALSQHRGAQYFSLTADGTKSNYTATAYIDGYAHGTTLQSYTSTNSYINTDFVPSTTVTAPTAPQSVVVPLLAFRTPTHTSMNLSNTFYIRVSIKMDNHLIFSNPVPVMPYNTVEVI